MSIFKISRGKPGHLDYQTNFFDKVEQTKELFKPGGSGFQLSIIFQLNILEWLSPGPGFHASLVILISRDILI